MTIVAFKDPAVFLIAVLLAFSQGQNVDIFNPQIFNYYFYVNSNSLQDNGITSEAAAKAHWATYGIPEGWQAAGNFHSRQYLDRYPDLKQAFGTNYLLAVNHYLTHGLSEGRLGYLEGGGYGRWTVSSGVNTGIFLGGSQRSAGAVDSVVWNGTEFINQWDHGRELQFAITTNNHGECYNPTEAGRSDDASGPGTTSVLKSIQAAGPTLTSSVLPAFWLAPGEAEPNPNALCRTALNTAAVSQYLTSKSVTIGARGIESAINYTFDVLVPEDLQWIQIESPTAYMSKDFTTFYTINTTSGHVAPIDQGPGEQPLPLIFTTSDNSRAMGAFIASHPATSTPIGYGRWYFTEATDSDTTSKWTMVFRNGPYPAGTHLVFVSYVCVGDMPTVVDCMKELAAD